MNPLSGRCRNTTVIPAAANQEHFANPKRSPFRNQAVQVGEAVVDFEDTDADPAAKKMVVRALGVLIPGDQFVLNNAMCLPSNL